MPSPDVIIKETDLSTRVPAFPGVYGAIVVPALKGQIDKPVLVTSDTQFLDEFTPDAGVNVGYDLAYFSALAYLQRSNKLWVMRAIGANYLSGGMAAMIASSSSPTITWATGEADPDSRTFLTDEVFTIFGKDPGAWNNSIRVAIRNSLNTETLVAASINASTDVLTVGQNIETGEPVRVTVGALGQLPDGVTAGVTYFVNRVTSSTVKLAVSQAAAVAGTPLIDLVIRTQAALNSTSDITEADDSIAVGADSGWITGDAVRVTLTSGAVPTGLAVLTTYYVVVLDATHIALATTYARAVASTPIIIALTQAVGVFVLTVLTSITLTPIYRLNEPNAFEILVFKSTDLNNPVERFTVSRVKEAKDGYGRSIYIEGALAESNYIRAYDNVLVTDTIKPRSVPVPLALSGGDDGDPVADGEMITASNQFVSVANIPVVLIMDGGWTTISYQQNLIGIAETRKDCYAILSTRYEDENNSDYLNALVSYRRDSLNANTSYAGLTGPHVKVFDRFNNRKIWVSPDGYEAGAISFTASNYEMWYPVGGFRRGVLNVEDTRRRFSKGEMDYLYDNGINPIRFYPGRGVVIWGQKTLLSRPSALDRQNVRFLLIVIEPAIKTALEDFLFELNDEATRFQAQTVVSSYMQDIKARRGVYSFRVVCDATNNKPVDIDNLRMNVWLFVQPVKAVEEIPFNVIITSTGVDFGVAQTLIQAQ